jgi:hypothetical protein
MMMTVVVYFPVGYGKAFRPNVHWLGWSELSGLPTVGNLVKSRGQLIKRPNIKINQASLDAMIGLQYFASKFKGSTARPAPRPQITTSTSSCMPQICDRLTRTDDLVVLR